MKAWTAGVVLICAGCSVEPPLGFSLVSTLPAATDGVVLRSAQVGSAAMADQICVLDVQQAEVLGDLDLGEGQERLLDAYDDDVLAALDGEIYLLPRDDVGGEVLAHWRISAIDARLIDGGVALLAEHEGRCAVAWSGQTAARSMWVIPETDCSGEVGLAVDRRAGTVWIADGSAVASVSPDGTFTRWDDVGADTVIWDRGVGQVLLGARGERWLQAVDPQGIPSWTRDLEGPLVDIDTAGDTGTAVVMTRRPRDRGQLDLIDTEVGWSAGFHPLPSTARVSFADDGTAMALVGADGVYFYDVDTDVGLLDVPPHKAVEGSGGVAPAAVGLSVASVLGTAVVVATIAD